MLSLPFVRLDGNELDVRLAVPCGGTSGPAPDLSGILELPPARLPGPLTVAMKLPTFELLTLDPGLLTSLSRGSAEDPLRRLGATEDCQVWEADSLVTSAVALLRLRERFPDTSGSLCRPGWLLGRMHPKVPHKAGPRSVIHWPNLDPRGSPLCGASTSSHFISLPKEAASTVVDGAWTFGAGSVDRLSTLCESGAAWVTAGLGAADEGGRAGEVSKNGTVSEG